MISTSADIRPVLLYGKQENLLIDFEKRYSEHYVARKYFLREFLKIPNLSIYVVLSIFIALEISKLQNSEYEMHQMTKRSRNLKAIALKTAEISCLHISSKTRTATPRDRGKKIGLN
jgi:hypothetical protein